MEELTRGNNFELFVKSYLWEGIFIDAKGVHCTTVEIIKELISRVWRL